MSDLITIQDYRNRPQTSICSFYGVKASDIPIKYKQYAGTVSPKSVYPETVAIEFYLLNSACAHIMQTVDKNQPLTSEQVQVLNRYYQSIENIGHRAFFYLFLICTREARHWPMTKGVKELQEKYGIKLDFFKLIPDSSSQITDYLLQNPLPLTIGNFTNLLYDVFMTNNFSGGFGNKAWANVTKPLMEFTNGNITMEMLLDTVWTLAHNNGPIFNKGMLFGHHDTTELVRILDVQRSGQIPNLVANLESKKLTPIHSDLLMICRQAIPDFGNGKVDWQKVVDLGALGSYGIKKSKVPKVVDSALPPTNGIFQVNTTEAVAKITRAQVK